MYSNLQSKAHAIENCADFYQPAHYGCTYKTEPGTARHWRIRSRRGTEDDVHPLLEIRPARPNGTDMEKGTRGFKHNNMPLLDSTRVARHVCQGRIYMGFRKVRVCVQRHRLDRWFVWWFVLYI